MTDQTNAIVPIQNRAGLMPALTIQDAIARYNAVIEFTKAVMKAGKDFGVIPGTGDKPTLLKPGAEKLCSLFGLYPDFELTGSIVDFETGLFYLQYKCILSLDGRKIASGVGSANSREKKYRYRNASRKCPKCGKETIIKGKEEFGGGWLCFEKKGGCKAKFADGDPAIEGQQVGQVENPDTADILNTLDKMAQKRALVAATLIATNASEFFTQDIEDMDFIDATFEEHKPAVKVSSQQPSAMSYENASTVLNSEGTLYIQIDSDKLAHMANSIQKALSANGKTPDEKEAYQFKLAAIQAILEHRKANLTA